MNSKNKGFAVVEILIVVAVIALIGFLGWTFYNKQLVGDTPSTVNTSAEGVMPEVSNDADLQSAENALEGIDIDSAVDTSDIDASLE